MISPYNHKDDMVWFNCIGRVAQYGEAYLCYWNSHLQLWMNLKCNYPSNIMAGKICYIVHVEEIDGGYIKTYNDKKPTEFTRSINMFTILDNGGWEI